MDLSHFHLVIFSKKKKINDSIHDFFLEQKIQVHWFETSQNVTDFIGKNPIDLLIFESESGNGEIFQLCNQIRNQINIDSLPIIEINHRPTIEKIIEAVNAGIDYIAPGPLALSWLSSFFENFFQIIPDENNPAMTKYQFNYDKFKLNIEQKRSVSLMISLAQGYIQDKELISTYIGSIAHDIRNPLTVIMGYSQLFLELLGDKISEEEKKILAAIDRSSNHILNILEGLLDISALDSAKVRLDISEVYFSEVVENCFNINKYLAEKKGIEFSLNQQENIPKIHCDRFKIEQVISNILTNAVKFSNSKTKITLSVSSDHENVYLSVEDQGQGILQEDFSKIFLDFGKTQTKPTQGEMSTGLGLAISKRIIDAHQGSISFGSSSGQGSTFYIALPIQSSHPI